MLNPYRRSNLAIRPVYWPTPVDEPTGPELAATDWDAEAFELFCKDSGTPIDYFDDREEAEEYLDLIAGCHER